MKRILSILLLIVFVAGTSACSVGFKRKFHKENWGMPKPKKNKKGKNHSWT